MPLTSTLGNGECLNTGESLLSPDGTCELKLEETGQLCLYKNGKIQWRKPEKGDSNTKCLTVQADGNVVI